jgi:hypothetical protein
MSPTAIHLILTVSALASSFAGAQQGTSGVTQQSQVQAKLGPCAVAPKAPSWFHPKLPPSVLAAVKNAQIKAGGSIDIEGAIKRATTQKPCVAAPAAPPAVVTPPNPKELCVVGNAPPNVVTAWDRPIVTRPCPANITEPDYVTSFPPQPKQ